MFIFKIMDKNHPNVLLLSFILNFAKLIKIKY